MAAIIRMVEAVVTLLREVAQTRTRAVSNQLLHQVFDEIDEKDDKDEIDEIDELDELDEIDEK